MKTIQQILKLFTCLMALVIFGVGCGGAVEEPQKVAEVAPAGTITFAEKDPEKGILRGSYEHQGYVIRFEVIRGAKTPQQALLIYPGVTSHSIDVRICDSQNYCFINGAGGHALADESWIKEDSTKDPTTEQSEQNFESVWGLHNDLDLQPIGTFDGLTEEVQSLKDASNQPPDTWKGIPPEYDPYHLKPKTLNQGTPLKSVLSLSAIASTYIPILQIWRQDIFWPIAYHSSTYAKMIDTNGQIASIYYTCNHGACANGNNGSMSLYCSRNLASRSTSAIPMNTRCADPATIITYHPNNGTIGCCSSVYSYVPLDLSHVCNDDSRLQRDMMIAGGRVSASYCSDRYLQGQAPSCW